MRLGAGTYSNVTRDVSRPDYAVKEMTSDVFECSVKELLILKSLNHANIIRLDRVEFGDDATCRMWMKCYPNSLGGTLKGIRERPLDMRDYLRIMTGVLSATSHLHSRNIIHCDIKPDNILVTNDLDPVLCDFNIARINIGRNHMSGNVQTRMYRAPEVKLSKERTKYNELIDVWSIGCVLWEILTGEYVIPRDSSDDTTNAACRFLSFTTAEDRKQRMSMLKTVRREHVADALRKKLQTTDHFTRVIVHGKYKKLFIDSVTQIIAAALVPTYHKRASASQLLLMAMDLVNQCTEVDVGVKCQAPTAAVGQFVELRNNRKKLNAEVSVTTREEAELLEGCDVVTSLVACRLAAVSVTRLGQKTQKVPFVTDNYVPPILTQTMIRIACAYIAACLLDEDIEKRVKKYIPESRDLVYIVSNILDSIQYDISCIL